jgi:hypothetical protein
MLPEQMKTLLSLALIAAPAVFSPRLHAQAYRIGVDPRVELMSILFRLAGNPEYMQGRVPAYVEAIDRHFGPYRDHEAVRLARRLRDADGVGFDAVMNMAVHVKDVESLAERVPFDAKDSGLERRWHGAKARKFLEAARGFVHDSKFSDFIASHKPLYDVTDSRLGAYVETNADLPWFDRFFGARPKARFIVIPGLVNGGSSYGVSLIAEDGVEEIYAIPGVWQVDAGGQPLFAGGWIETLVHEFAHSYVNPVVNAFLPQMEKSGPMLYEPVRQAMSQQTYSNWQTMLRESLVRASTIRYILEHQGEQAAQRAAESEQARSFLWTGELARLLGEYEKDRKTYPTLESFMPHVIAFFAETAPKTAERVRKQEEARPKVAGMNIANGAQDVDPALKAIVIRFDRPMQKTSYSVMRLGSATYPKTGTVSFDETGTVFTMPVTLEPSHNYEFGLNFLGGGSFLSQDGVRLEQVVVRFRTR